MNSKRLFLILLLVACALNSAFSAGIKLPASCRNAGDPLMDPPGLQFDMDPTPYCSISSGSKWTWQERLENGAVQGNWSPATPTLVAVGASARITGYGWADLSVTHTNNSRTRTDNRSEKVDCFIVVSAFPESKKKNNEVITVYVEPYSFGTAYGYYRLDYHGSFNLQAVHWKAEAGIPIQGGTWERNPGELNSRPFRGTTSWRIEQRRNCSNCGQQVSYFNQHKLSGTWNCPGLTANNGGTGTTESPTIGKNGGGTGNGETTGGGSTGGTSSDRVRCGAGSRCGRGGYARHRNTHRSTCAAGHFYWTCSSSDVTAHSPHTARPANSVRCGNRWSGYSGCSSGGYASSENAHRTTCAAGHAYWSCNRNAVSSHSGHTASSSRSRSRQSSTVTCARSSCSAQVSSRNVHSVRCSCGSSYWSCNSSAVAWHATSYTCARSGCSSTFTRCTMDTGSARSCRSNGRNYRWHSR